MYRFIICAALIAVSYSAKAAEYNCKMSDGTEKDPKAVSFKIDTNKDDNKHVQVGPDLHVGCVVFRASPEILTCGLGSSEKFSIFTTADVGTSVLGLHVDSGATTVRLTCVKQK